MKKQFLETGQIVSVHGVHGEVKVNPWSDSPAFLCGFTRFYLDKDGTTCLEAERVRAHGNVVLIKFVGFDSVESTVALRGKTMYINRDDCTDEEGWFVQDLIGLVVLDADTGERYGTITDVLQTGANDVYQIAEPGKKDKLVPAIQQVVLRVDVNGGVMHIRPLEGLFDAD